MLAQHRHLPRGSTDHSHIRSRLAKKPFQNIRLRVVVGSITSKSGSNRDWSPMLFAGLAKPILGRQCSRAALENLAVEVEQLLASPSTLELILGLNFLDPRADAWFSSEGRGAITVIVGRPGRARRPVLN